MNQPDLFDTPPREQQAPVARSSDKATSHEGAAVVGLKMGELRQRMYDAIKELMLSGTIPTANEAAVRCVKLHGGNQESYRKRARELADDAREIVDEMPARKCDVTGKNATTYAVTEKYL